MYHDQVSASFRSLIEKCLKQAMAQNSANAEPDFCHDRGCHYHELQNRPTEIETRTEVNQAVIREFLRV